MRTRERPSRPHRGLEAREIGARDQIEDGIIEFWVDAESEIFDFRGLDDRTSIEHLSKIDRKSIEHLHVIRLGCDCAILFCADTGRVLLR